MTRRTFLKIVMVAGAAAYPQSILSAQDVQYVRAIERAQRDRPSRVGNTARIAPISEPGDPLIVRGRLLNIKGMPARDAVVFAYHTDRGGMYDTPENGPHSWRLRGWARTDEEGRFTFETVRPGSYPNSSNPPHVHFTAYLASGERYHAGELQLSMTRPANTPVPEETSVELRLQPRDRF